MADYTASSHRRFGANPSHLANRGTPETDGQPRWLTWRGTGESPRARAPGKGGPHTSCGAWPGPWPRLPHWAQRGLFIGDITQQNHPAASEARESRARPAGSPGPVSLLSVGCRHPDALDLCASLKCKSVPCAWPRAACGHWMFAT